MVDTSPVTQVQMPTIGPSKCAKCGVGSGGHTYRFFVAGKVVELCTWHGGRLMSALAQCGLAHGERLSDPHRAAILKWFLSTKYFSFRRRLSRGRAKRLLVALDVQAGSGELNPANMLNRGPHDPVVDAAPSSPTCASS